MTTKANTKPPLTRLAYRIAEFADVSGMAPATIRRRIKAGELASIKVGRCRLIPASAADKLLEGK